MSMTTVLRILDEDLLDDLLLVRSMLSRSRPSRPSPGSVQGRVSRPRGIVPGVASSPQVGLLPMTTTATSDLLAALRACVFAVGRVIGGVVHFHVGADFILNALQRRDGIGRRAAVPVPMHDSRPAGR